MMIVPDHWAEARRQHRAGGRQWTVRRFGWSVHDAADAVAMAEQRADEALARLVAGETLPRREPKVAYNGAQGVPIREEVLARHGDDVITRNAYGARCLNSPHALFADVDFDQPASPGAAVALFAALALPAIGAGFLAASWGLALFLLLAAAFLCLPLARALRRLLAVLQGGVEATARRRVEAFVARHPRWNVRLYRTPAGLRLLATDRPHAPSDPEVSAFFAAVGADPVYVRMCLNQHCFRARLSAKPWRIGIPAHLRPRPGVWPVAPERAAVRAAWIADYEARAAGFAACRYLGAVGSGRVDPGLADVVALHDRESRATDAHATLA